MYNIKRDGVEIASVEEKTYTDTGLTPETDYAYTVEIDGVEDSEATVTTKTTVPKTHIVVANREITWADLPALDQPDNGSLTLLSTEVRDDVVVGRDGDGTIYETRTVYTYEADFDWDNYHMRSGGITRDWIFDVLQFKNNQLKNGSGAFVGMRAEQLTALPDLDTSNLTDMTYMFYLAKYFDQPLDNFDLSNVEPGSSMKSFLAYAYQFNQDLSGWCVEHIGPVNNEWQRETGIAHPIRPQFWEDPTKHPKWGEPC
jgi:hypothetical protein